MIVVNSLLIASHFVGNKLKHLPSARQVRTYPVADPMPHPFIKKELPFTLNCPSRAFVHASTRHRVSTWPPNPKIDPEYFNYTGCTCSYKHMKLRFARDQAVDMQGGLWVVISQHLEGDEAWCEVWDPTYPYGVDPDVTWIAVLCCLTLTGVQGVAGGVGK